MIEDKKCGKNQNKNMIRGTNEGTNEDQMSGHYKQLSENAQKWVGVYKEENLRTNGMSRKEKDAENEAHKIYEASRNNFNDIIFLMKLCALELHCDTTRYRPECEAGNEKSGGSTKRSRTTEEGEYCVHSNPETPTSDGLTVKHPKCCDAAKKGKRKASNEITTKLHSLCLTRENELEVMKK
uniref:No apical meristem-associated C-terminal domain-containing protein n=1 Tax=Lactuca sativa TaxID=4236 RepID=A0A9R1W5W6_LACSA|nr:hypothetical protein LSAT_V11C300115350 [Lactuca sativa]